MYLSLSLSLSLSLMRQPRFINEILSRTKKVHVLYQGTERMCYIKTLSTCASTQILSRTKSSRPLPCTQEEDDGAAVTAAPPTYTDKVSLSLSLSRARARAPRTYARPANIVWVLPPVMDIVS